MATRMVTGLGLAITLYLVTAASAVQARGFKQHGLLVRQPATFHDVTGKCSCNWKWYTVGLRPGRASFSLTVQSAQAIGQATYDARLSLFDGGVTVTAINAACSRSQKRCGRSAHVTVPIKHAGVYYIAVHGEGADGVRYSLHIGGNIYRLR